MEPAPDQARYDLGAFLRWKAEALLAAVGLGRSTGWSGQRVEAGVRVGQFGGPWPGVGDITLPVRFPFRLVGGKSFRPQLAVGDDAQDAFQVYVSGQLVWGTPPS